MIFFEGFTTGTHNLTYLVCTRKIHPHKFTQLSGQLKSSKGGSIILIGELRLKFGELVFEKKYYPAAYFFVL